ncbi:hypothetical protein LCGC14_0823550 [marine sediment metagenome]|uniref:Exonuclease domain-containing protein n=1 Tax=marine sediment metagenome TaxID=412755 RepID=A0A0F9Q3B7_9ZZZZ
MKYYFSLDIESVGLFGQPISAGWVIVDEKGKELEEGYLARPVQLHRQDDAWIIENVEPAMPRDETGNVILNCNSEYELLVRFWEAWLEARQQYPGIVMVSDCPWPVEAGFLLRVVQEYRPQITMKDAPYPILDVASVVAASGGDPTATFSREANELPAHDPTKDARQSVRIMLTIMEEISSDRGLAIAHGFYGPVLPQQTGKMTFTEMEADCELSAATFTDARVITIKEPHE